MFINQLNNFMSKKISELTTAAKPLSGREIVVMNQNGSTVTAVLSDVKTYTNTGLDYAVKNANNNFTTGQTITGPVTAQYITLSGGTNPLSISVSRGLGTSSVLISDHNLSRSNQSVSIGSGAGYNSADGGTASNIIAIGTSAGNYTGCFGGTSTEIISIGHGAGEYLTTSSNVISIGYSANRNAGGNFPQIPLNDVISIGKLTGESIGSNNFSGPIENVILIGKQAGQNLGTFGNSYVSEAIFIGDSAGYNTANGTDSFIESVVGIGQGACMNLGTFEATSDISTITDSVFIGATAGINIKDGATIANCIAVGSNSSNSMCLDTGSAYSIITIGDNAGEYMGSLGGSINDIIVIGSYSGSYLGSSLGVASNIIAIGKDSASGAAYAGNVTDLISIGYSAANGTISASNVIAIGKSAGENAGNVEAIANSIYIGQNSGSAQTASYNTFVGDFTNTSDAGNSALSGCIALGYGATPSARNTIAIGSSTVPLSVVPGQSLATSLSGLKIMINGTYYTIPLLA